VIVIHGTRRWFEHRGELRQEGRVTRHYDDVHRLLGADVSRAAEANRSLAAECVRHARMFFDRPDLDLAQAAPGTYALAPSPAIRERLARDDENMAAMIFGPIEKIRSASPLRGIPSPQQTPSSFLHPDVRI
jgi:hypothetical protein